ncbi:MAG: hypothetical protein A2X76_01325 [Lysobacterales bacterium GWF1_69_6]|nr:MAG: hypothetical protein A2X76_01325 [Xanthomonadales bacterium GWF1_69_6]
MDVKAFAVALLLTLAALPTFAADNTVGTLSEIQADTLVLRARAEQADAKKKLGEDAAGVAPATSSAYGATNPGGIAPVVRGVHGANKNLYATFLYSNGSTVEARQGDQIPGGFRVIALSAERVEIQRGSERIQVGFSSIPPIATVKLTNDGATPMNSASQP